MTTTPSIRATATYTSESTSSISLTIPASAQVGDKLLIYFFCAPSATLPAGWDTIYATLGGRSLAAIERTCQVGDPGSTVTITLGAAGLATAEIVALQNCNLLAANVKVYNTFGATGVTFTNLFVIKSALHLHFCSTPATVDPTLNRGALNNRFNTPSNTVRSALYTETPSDYALAQSMTWSWTTNNAYYAYMTVAALNTEAGQSMDGTAWTRNSTASASGGEVTMLTATGASSIIEAAPAMRSVDEFIITGEINYTSGMEFAHLGFVLPHIASSYLTPRVGNGGGVIYGDYPFYGFGVNFNSTVQLVYFNGQNTTGQAGSTSGWAAGAWMRFFLYFKRSDGVITMMGGTDLTQVTTVYTTTDPFDAGAIILPKMALGVRGVSSTIKLRRAVIYGSDEMLNNTFASATSKSIPPKFSTRGDVSSFTTEGSEPLTLPSSHTGWIRFKPAYSGSYRFDTIGSGFDTALAVYSGTALGSLSLIASDDDSGGGTASQVTVSLTAGTDYALQVGGKGSGGAFILNSTPTVSAGLLKGRGNKYNDSQAGG